MPNDYANASGEVSEDYYDIATWNNREHEWELNGYFLTLEEGRKRLAAKRGSIRTTKRNADFRLVRVQATTTLTEVD